MKALSGYVASLCLHPFPPGEEKPPRVEEIPYDPNQLVPVLEYHNPSYVWNINENQRIYMTPAIYERQLRIISEMDFYTPSQQDILGWVEGKHGLPQRSLFIRIDLGVPYKDYEDGFGLLEAYRLRGMLFINTGQIPEVSTEHKVGWDVISDFVCRGVLIPGSHGTNHPHYSRISEADALTDALGSKEEIEGRLARPIYFFAFPYDASAHEDALLEHFSLLFGAYGNFARAGNPLVGTFYPYARGREFDWEGFRENLSSYDE